MNLNPMLIEAGMDPAEIEAGQTYALFDGNNYFMHIRPAERGWYEGGYAIGCRPCISAAAASGGDESRAAQFARRFLVQAAENRMHRPMKASEIEAIWPGLRRRLKIVKQLPDGYRRPGIMT